ncbi:MAG: hypothetical protein HOC27_07505 [Phycisphaerae bacterium]|jgi:hypothetical protein|nr:hypothetical protein [Phycisphaerae bacterium]
MLDNQNNNSWIVSATFLVVIVLFGIRWSSDILTKGPVFDEKYITVPIHNLINEGWSVETAIDFEETKGPAMIWPYAIAGKLFGGTLNDLRVVSVWFSILALLVLSWIALKSGVQKHGFLMVAIGWLLLPYNLVFSEIVMGEISFLLLSLLAVMAFLWGVEHETKTKRIIAPVLYCIAVVLALHSRIHVVALTGAICVTAYSLQGIRSWPWWVASVVAGLLRIPLWLRWGGLVSPEYQALHGLGFRIESLSYLAAALFPFVGVFAIEAWRLAKGKMYLVASFCFGVLLVFIAMPDLSIPESIDFLNPNDRFQGIVASVVTRSSSSALVQQSLLACFAGVGLAGLVGVWNCRAKARYAGSITFWALTFGWLLYAVTRGFVFDRFLLTWAFLLPIMYVRALPKWILVGQYIFLAGIAAYLTASWL